jgi:hypothetical protein
MHRGPEEDVAARKQERARRRRAWRHGEAWVAAGLAWRRGGRQLGKNYGGSRLESGTWDHREAGGGTRLLRRRAAARGGSGGQPGGVAEAGVASTGSGKAAARQGRARGLSQSGAGVVGVQHMPAERRRRCAQKNRGRREVDEGGLKLNFSKAQGLHCNV